MSDALTTPRIIFCRVQPPELYRKNLKVAPPPLAVYSYKVRNQIAFTVVINDLFTAIRSYHTAGRPTGVSNGILDITGDKSLVHTYDGQACRVTRTVREWSGTGWRATETVQFIYDGWNPIAKYFSDESPPEVYLWGLDLSGSMQGAGGVGGLLAVPWDGFDTFYPTYDGNGNVSEYLDTAGTNIVHYEYDPSGGLTRLTGNTSTRFQYRFSTKPRDLTTGLYYYGYRYYDPLTGRWPSRDPIEERGGVNLYGFVGNDGVNELDKLGLREQTVEKCVSYLYIGHGNRDNPITYNIRSGCSSAGAVVCFPKSNNPKTPHLRWPDIPEHDEQLGSGSVGTVVSDQMTKLNNLSNDEHLGGDSEGIDDPAGALNFQKAADNALAAKDEVIKKLCKGCSYYRVVIELGNDDIFKNDLFEISKRHGLKIGDKTIFEGSCP